MGSCCGKHSFVLRGRFAGKKSNKDDNKENNKCPLMLNIEEKQNKEKKEEEEREKSKNQNHQTNKIKTIAKTSTTTTITTNNSSSAIINGEVIIHTNNNNNNNNNTGNTPPILFYNSKPNHNNVEQYEMSDTIICSSTTIDETSAVFNTFQHNRVETAASSTWPDVSLPTASILYEAPRTFADIDSVEEEEFSPVERSCSTLHERRVSFLIREKEKAARREIIIKESEKRKSLIELCNNNFTNMQLRYYKSILGIERRAMLIAYFRERYILLLKVVEAQETIGRRTIELTSQALLLNRMQQHRLDRRQNSPSIGQSRSRSISSGLVAGHSTLSAFNNNNNNNNNIEAAVHHVPDDESEIEISLAASEQRGIERKISETSLARSLSAPSGFWRQLQQSQRNNSLSVSPVRRRKFNNNNNKNKKLSPSLAAAVHHLLHAESITRLEIEQEEILQRQQCTLF